MSPVYFPAVGALVVLALDLVSRSTPSDRAAPRAIALSGIRLGSVAFFALVTALVSVENYGSGIDSLGIFGVSFVTVSGVLVVGLSLTHFGMARARPAEPIALLLFSLSGMTVAIVTDHFLILMIALEMAWLPMIALISMDSRRLSSSESSLKAFFAHAFSSVVLAHGVAFLFGATGDLDFSSLGTISGNRPLLFDVGVTLVIVGLLARAAIAPFHPWSPDVHEGAPSFVTTHVVTALQATTFFVLLRVLHALAPANPDVISGIAARVPELLAVLGCIGLVWGHAMALVQVGLRRLLGWLGVGQIGFFTLALVDATGDGGSALLLALFASSVSATGVLAILSSLSHHERACENVGDLSGMMRWSPIRAALLALFLLSLGGFPGTVGFVARVEVLAALEHSGHRSLLVVGLGATVMALTAVGRPLLAILRTTEAKQDASGALTNEQLVLTFCGIIVVYFGIAPVVSAENFAGSFLDWIDAALTSVRS